MYISTQNVKKLKNWYYNNLNKKNKKRNNGIYDGEQIDYTIDNGNEEEVIISTETYKLVPDFSSPIVEKDILKPELYISPKNEKI